MTLTDDVDSILHGIAELLTQLCRVGKVRLRHDSVISDYGYVLPTDDGYVARTLSYLPFDRDETV